MRGCLAARRLFAFADCVRDLFRDDDSGSKGSSSQGRPGRRLGRIARPS